MFRLSLRSLSIACCALISLFEPACASPLSWSKWHKKSHHEDFAKRNLRTISSIYNLTVYPNQIPIILGDTAGVPSGLFSQNVVGRVDPVGDFVGFQDSIEYFFALAPLPQGNAASAAITSYKIVEYSSACKEVAASVVYLYASILNTTCPEAPPIPLAPLKQVAFWRFDSHGAVLKYDAWIPNLNQWVNAITSVPGANISLPEFQQNNIEQICGATQLRCFGSNAQWNNTSDCIAGLSKKPYGDYDEAWGDNIVCRNIHVVLTLVRPDVHCPHVGPTGGMKCVDNTYLDKYFQDQSLYNDTLGTTFTCGK